MKNLGKNKISYIKKNKEVLGFNKYYKYDYYSINKTIKIKNSSCDLFFYVLKCSNTKSKIFIRNKKFSLSKDKLLRINKKKSDIINIKTTSKIIFLIVYNHKESSNSENLKIKEIKDIYTVVKPWGYEKWLTGNNNKNFAFKKIFLKKGTKTSLQYHVKKIETNFLFNGKAKLHYLDKKINLIKKNFLKINKNVKNKTLDSGSIINVKPKTIHRLQAVSNLMLYEVSSPHLSDVIRISDDSNRPDGKIQNEHRKKLA